MLIIECTDGWYGLNCTGQCVGHCRDDSACNHMTGLCERGCDAGWTGNMRNKGSVLTKVMF